MLGAGYQGWVNSWCRISDGHLSMIPLFPHSCPCLSGRPESLLHSALHPGSPSQNTPAVDSGRLCAPGRPGPQLHGLPLSRGAGLHVCPLLPAARHARALGLHLQRVWAPSARCCSDPPLQGQGHGKQGTARVLCLLGLFTPAFQGLPPAPWPLLGRPGPSAKGTQEWPGVFLPHDPARQLEHSGHVTPVPTVCGSSTSACGLRAGREPQPCPPQLPPSWPWLCPHRKPHQPLSRVHIPLCAQEANLISGAGTRLLACCLLVAVPTGSWAGRGGGLGYRASVPSSPCHLGLVLPQPGESCCFLGTSGFWQGWQGPCPCCSWQWPSQPLPCTAWCAHLSSPQQVTTTSCHSEP
jgi:hypothetical protein